MHGEASPLGERSDGRVGTAKRARYDPIDGLVVQERRERLCLTISFSGERFVGLWSRGLAVADEKELGHEEKGF
jgi:hypothetical protein